jgi:Na+-transporting NADH:ubiquinone oxidoreductase subunit A
MALHVIKRGLNLPITGDPEQRIDGAAQVSRVAVMAKDYPFMKPRMHVRVGDDVKLGQLLFEDRKTEGVRFTSPGAGKVEAINRGERRALISVVIRLSGNDQVSLQHFSGDGPASLNGEAVRNLLVESGLWTALRTRPYSKVPAPGESCHAVFVTAMDTNPGAPSPELALQGREADWSAGLQVVSKLTEGKVFLCTAAGSAIGSGGVDRIAVEQFKGPHPAGLAGTHIHLLDPVNREKTAFYLDYQDVLAIGHLFRTGEIDTTRVIALSGPQATRPRLLKTRLGAAVDEIVEGEVKAGETRVVSGSVIAGRSATGEISGYLGRYHSQISVLAEDREQRFLGWIMPGAKIFSTVNVYLSALIPGKKFGFTTTTNGSHRAMVPIGMYERVMPLDIIPTYLLRALVMDDLENAEKLGCLELDEDDLALCSMVCPGKEDYGVALRRTLTQVWKEG